MAKQIQQSFRRFEKKYLLTGGQYEELLAGLAPYMEEDAYGRYTICNVYYDSDSFQLIRASLDGPVYKEKLRLRSYGVPAEGQTVFLEMKKKFDHIVYKRRLTLPCAEAVSYLAGHTRPQEESQILHELDWLLRTYRLRPRVFIAYDRFALAGLADPQLRVTFDSNLRWREDRLDLRLGDEGKPLLPRDRILMETKISGTAPLWLGRLLSEAGAFPTSYSKYGACYRQNLLAEAFPGCAAPTGGRSPESEREDLFYV